MYIADDGESAILIILTCANNGRGPRTGGAWLWRQDGIIRHNNKAISHVTSNLTWQAIFSRTSMESIHDGATTPPLEEKCI